MKLFASLTLSITMLSSFAWSAPANDAQTQVANKWGLTPLKIHCVPHEGLESLC